MMTYITIIGVIKFSERILILRRSATRDYYPDRWQPVTGFVRERETAEEAVSREVREETGLDGHIIRSGKVIEVADEGSRWVIVPFLVEVGSMNVTIDLNEHSEFRWINPKDIAKYTCAPGTEEALKSLGFL
jgi:ADP-ribose pyrophosphatase YjhB (NUDIX family)